MDAYSILLAAALALAVLAFSVGLWSRFGKPGAEGPRRLVRRCGLLALPALMTAATVHLIFGHRPGTERALDPIAFVGEHPALLVVAALALAAIWFSRQ